MQTLIILLFFIFALRFFQSTPIEPIFFQIQAAFLVAVAAFLLYYLFHLAKYKHWNCIHGIYFSILALTLPLYYGVRAQFEFCQPLLSGILAGRHLILLGAGVLLWYLILTRTITLTALKTTFLATAWASLLIFSYFYLTIDPDTVDLSEGTKMMKMSQERGLRFKFQTFFITFGAIYYFVKYANDKKLLSLVAFILFFGYIAGFVQGRVYTLSVAATIAVYIWLTLGFQRAMTLSLQFALIIVAALFTVYLTAPEFLETMALIYHEMFVVLSGEESSDYSANSRIYQTAIVTGYFSEHPWSILFGTGSVSHHWNDGYVSLLGYFYPSDTGLVGALFVYGAIGVALMMLIPMFMVLRAIRIKTPRFDHYLIALKLMLVYSLIKIPAGAQFFASVDYLVPLFILAAWQRITKQQRPAGATNPHIPHPQPTR